MNVCNAFKVDSWIRLQPSQNANLNANANGLAAVDSNDLIKRLLNGKHVVWCLGAHSQSPFRFQFPNCRLMLAQHCSNPLMMLPCTIFVSVFRFSFRLLFLNDIKWHKLKQKLSSNRDIVKLTENWIVKQKMNYIFH